MTEEISIEELKGHYETNFLSSEQFIQLVNEWHKKEVKKLNIDDVSKCLTTKITTIENVLKGYNLDKIEERGMQKEVAGEIHVHLSAHGYLK